MKLNLHWHQILISLLIGMFIGYAATQLPLLQYCGKGWKKGDMKSRMITKLSKKLDLSAEQKTKLAAIFEAKRPQMKALHDEMRPKFEALKDSTRADIRKILNPKQQVKFEELNKKWDERMNKRWSKFDSPEKNNQLSSRA